MRRKSVVICGQPKEVRLLRVARIFSPSPSCRVLHICAVDAVANRLRPGSVLSDSTSVRWVLHLSLTGQVLYLLGQS